MATHCLKFDWLDGRRIVFPQADSEEEQPPGQAWRRVLYARQSFPDNYVPRSFLRRPMAPGGAREQPQLSLAATSKWTACIVQHASMVVLFILTWHNLRWWRMPVEALMALDVVLLAIGYTARHTLLKREGSPARSLLNEGVASMYVFGTIWILSPVLKTLTMAWAEDSIYAMAVILMVVHGFLHDYGFVYRPTPTHAHQRGSDFSRLWREVDNPLALNAAMFAAIILASRLETVTHVFAFEFFAITCFMLLPTAAKLVFRTSEPVFTIYLTLAVVICTVYAVVTIAGVHVLVIYLLGLGLVTLVAPWLFLRLQGLRMELKGPWDIVHVNRRGSLTNLKPAADLTPASPRTPLTANQT